MLRIINTIEFVPLDFTDNYQEYIDVHDKEKQFEYWKKCLEDSNIVNLKPILPNSWLVDIDNLSDDNLNILMDNNLRKYDIHDYSNGINVEELLPFSGGLVILDEKNILISTNCCGDLSDLNNWKDIFKAEVDRWHKLWIGHPFVYYRKRNGNIEFSQATENELSENIEIKHQISENWLKTNIDNIRVKQIQLLQRLENIAKDKQIPNTLELAQRLTGLE